MIWKSRKGTWPQVTASSRTLRTASYQRSPRSTTPTVKLGVIVQGAVNAGLIINTPQSRREFADWARKDASAAVIAVAGYRKIAAARHASASAPLPAGRTPTTASGGTNATTYPAAWQQAARRAPGLRAAAYTSNRVTAASITPDTPYPANWLAGSALVAKVLSRRGGTPRQPAVHAAGDTAALIAAHPHAQETALAASQHSTAGYHDPHDLIAAAGDNAKRLADAQRAELDRMQRERLNRATG